MLQSTGSFKLQSKLYASANILNKLSKRVKNPYFFIDFKVGLYLSLDAS
jgi:hypothetical protein